MNQKLIINVVKILKNKFVNAEVYMNCTNDIFIKFTNEFIKYNIIIKISFSQLQKLSRTVELYEESENPISRARGAFNLARKVSEYVKEELWKLFFR